MMTLLQSFAIQGDDFLKKNATRITTIVAVLLSLLWIFGLAWSIQDFYYGKAASCGRKGTFRKGDRK